MFLKSNRLGWAPGSFAISQVHTREMRILCIERPGLKKQYLSQYLEPNQKYLIHQVLMRSNSKAHTRLA